MTWQDRIEAAIVEYDRYAPAPVLAMDRAMKRAGLRDLIVERDRYRDALVSLMQFAHRLMNSNDEGERGIGACIAEGARVVESRPAEEAA